MEVLKRPRLSCPVSELTEERHGESVIHSLLNFSENFSSFDSRYRMKRPQVTFDEIKLAPLHNFTQELPPIHSEFIDRSPRNSVPFKQESQRPTNSPTTSPTSSPTTKFDALQDLQTSASLALADLPFSHSVKVVTEPVGFQIANYNIHPPPAVSVDRAISQNITIHAQLVENEKRTVVDGGFQSGDVRVLRAGHTTLYFTGLKLNKMGPIKTELHFRDYKRIPTTFRIQFKIGNRTIFSEPFKLVSSCAQLPQEVRDVVRPTKKTARSGSPEPQGNDILASPLNIVPPSLSSTVDLNEPMLRRDLEVAIEAADEEGAAKAAKKLAYLRKANGHCQN